jgi:hypothetical protein
VRLLFRGCFFSAKKLGFSDLSPTALFMSSGSGLRLSPLLMGSSVPQQMAMSAAVHVSPQPAAKTLPAGEFFITEWIDQGNNIDSAHPNVPVCFKVVRQESFRPAVRVVGVESNVTYEKSIVQLSNRF